MKERGGRKKKSDYQLWMDAEATVRGSWDARGALGAKNVRAEDDHSNYTI